MEVLANDLSRPQQDLNQHAAWTSKKLGCKIQTLLMKKLQEDLEIEDGEVPDACLHGLGIVGRAQESPFFDPFHVPASISWGKYLATCQSRSQEMIDRVKFMGQKSEVELTTAIYTKTQKEIQSGTMGPPMTLEQVKEKYGDNFQVVPSFGLSQGTDSKGQPKYRRIDDHSACWNNQVATRAQKVPMAMIDYVAVMFRALANQGFTHLLSATEDMKGAYRQIPLLPSEVRYAITGVYSPESREVTLHEMYGQPFGAGHAVPNFCRVAEWLSRLIARKFHIMIDHFFDDFWIIEPKWSVSSAVFCLNRAFALLGFTLDPEKTQPPHEICAILGVLFNTTALSREKKLLISAKPSRIANLTQVIHLCLTKGELSPALAASIVGKFGFLCSTLFGKVGRCCTGSLRARQYSSYPHSNLTPALRTSLQLMLLFLQHSPSREVRSHQTPPVILYTDASDVPGRSPRFGVGAVLYDPADEALLYSASDVPSSVISRWLPKQSYMGQLELLAAPFALATWQSRLRSRSVLLFIDNDSAAANLVKGYSPNTDSAPIVGEFWLRAASQTLHIYLDRVESKSNISDGPSRFSYEELTSMGGIWTNPNFGSLLHPSTDPAEWFGAPLQRGEI